jgi:hypothetical protein
MNFNEMRIRMSEPEIQMIKREMITDLTFDIIILFFLIYYG